jgi:hypothetical protein
MLTTNGVDGALGCAGSTLDPYAPVVSPSVIV